MKHIFNKNLIKVVFIAMMYILITSCGTKEIKLFSKEHSIVFNKMNIGEYFGSVRKMKSINDYLIITAKSVESSTQVQLVDKKTKVCYSFGQIGEGPGRLLLGYDIIPINDKHIGIYDLNKWTIFDFAIDSILRYKEHYEPEILIKGFPKFALAVDRLNDSTYVSMAIEDGLKRFSLVNKYGEIITTTGAIPPKKDKNISDFAHAFAYYGKLTTNQNEQKVAICTHYAGIFQIYDCKTLTEIKLLKEHFLFSADYEVRSGNFVPNSRTRWGYISIDSNDKYVFALYSGLNQSENEVGGAFMKCKIVHVFDWNGNPVCQLSLNREIINMCVDDSNLYGYDDEDEDIVVADITSIL
jgi:hypothetical protein